MAWIMKYDSRVLGDNRKKTPGESSVDDDTAMQSIVSKMGNRVGVAYAFAYPPVSPIWRALSIGRQMLGPEDESRNFCSLLHFRKMEWSQAVLAVWRSMLPSLSRVWWTQKVHLVESFPCCLFILLGDASDHMKQSVADRFFALKRCCCPRGIWPLRAAVQEVSDCFQLWFLDLVRGMAEQF